MDGNCTSNGSNRRRNKRGRRRKRQREGRKIESNMTENAYFNCLYQIKYLFIRESYRDLSILPTKFYLFSI